MWIRAKRRPLLSLSLSRHPTLNFLEGASKFLNFSFVAVSPLPTTSEPIQLRIIPYSIYNLTENQSLTIDLSTIIITATPPITYEVLLTQSMRPEAYDFLVNQITLNRFTGSLNIIRAVSTLDGPYSYTISVTDAVATAYHSLILNIPPSYTAEVQWQTDNNTKVLASSSITSLQLKLEF
jgi:hypothetical protein